MPHCSASSTLSFSLVSLRVLALKAVACFVVLCHRGLSSNLVVTKAARFQFFCRWSEYVLNFLALVEHICELFHLRRVTKKCIQHYQVRLVLFLSPPHSAPMVTTRRRQEEQGSRQHLRRNIPIPDNLPSLPALSGKSSDQGRRRTTRSSSDDKSIFSNDHDEEATPPLSKTNRIPVEEQDGLSVHLKKQLVADIEAAGGIQVVSIKRLCDSKPDIYGDKGSAKRRQVQNKENRWEKFSLPEYNSRIVKKTNTLNSPARLQQELVATPPTSQTKQPPEATRTNKKHQPHQQSTPPSSTTPSKARKEVVIQLASLPKMLSSRGKNDSYYSSDDDDLFGTYSSGTS